MIALVVKGAVGYYDVGWMAVTLGFLTWLLL
jgi:hypothetical protein